MACKALQHSPLSRRQAGFILPSLAIGVILVTLIAGSIFTRYAQADATARADERAKLVGVRLAAIDDAVKTYATSYFTQIQRQQQIERNGHTVPVSRVRTPTPVDLFHMDLLSEQNAAALVYNGRSIGFDIRLSVPSTGCTIPNCNVTALVVSTEPMVDLQSPDEVDLRRAAIAAKAAGSGRSGISLPETPGTFVSIDNANIGANAGGIAGLIAISNGYDSRGFLEFARRDGSLPMTGDINMQDDSAARHSIRNADGVSAQTVSAAGRLKTGEFLEFDGLHVVAGTECAKQGLVGTDAVGFLFTCQSSDASGGNLVWKKVTGDTGAFLHKPAKDYAGQITWPAKIENGVVKLCETLACYMGKDFIQHTIIDNRNGTWNIATRSKLFETSYPDRDGFIVTYDRGWSGWTHIPYAASNPTPTPAGLVFTVSGGGNINDTPNMVIIPWGE